MRAFTFKDILTGTVLAGLIGAASNAPALAAGVPMFMGYGGGNPVIFLQTPKEVWLFFSGDMQVRRVYMNVPRRPSRSPHGTANRLGITKARPSSSTR